MTTYGPPLLVGTPAWLIHALREAGEQEIAGAGTNPRIARYLQSCHLPASVSDETPWCSAFVNWCMYQAGVQGTQSAAARSWEHWGMPLSEPTLGCVAVLWRENPSCGKGHVGFWLRTRGNELWLWGGNQGNRVCAQAYPLNQLLGFRAPGAR